MKVYNLQINHLSRPIGISPDGLRVTWNIEGCLRQSSYEIRLLSSPSGSVCWDSGKQESGETFCEKLPTLSFRTSYVLKLTAWDENYQPCQAETILLHTGMDVKNPESWAADWINPELTKISPKKRARASYLRKTFTLTKEQLTRAVETRDAWLYMTSHGIFDVWLNGTRATDHRLMPGTNQENKRLMVESLPVSALLKEGENELLVTLGDGWHRGAMGYGQSRHVFGSDVALLGQLMLGDEIPAKTDLSWQATQEGPLGENDFMEGECYDARLEELKGWHEVKAAAFGFENLIPVDTVPITEHETFLPDLLVTPKGETVLDFHQNLVGYVHMEFYGSSGKKMILTHGEVLDKDGNFTIANLQPMGMGAPVKQRVEYICREGRNCYQPSKTYMGFRYVKVEADFPVEASWFKAIALYSDIRTAAQFRCGNDKVNQLFANALWSMKGNFIDVPTDCPTREKSGYSGDAQAFCYTAAILMDCYPVLAKWLREQAAGQFDDGVIPQVAPSPKGTEKDMTDGGIGWSDSIEIVPYELYRRYQDKTILEENYEAIRRWMDYQILRAKETHPFNQKIVPEALQEYTIDHGWMWGEWLEPGGDYGPLYMLKMKRRGDIEVGTAYFYYGCRLTSEIAAFLGKQEASEYYAGYAEKAREAYRSFNLKDGKIQEEKRQCRYVRPLYMGILDDNEKPAAADQLVRLIRANGNKLNTGFLTTHALCKTLTDNGQNETAYDLLLQEDKPGWLYPVSRGCTTIPESWDCYDKKGNPSGSFNHYSYGAVAGWLMDSVCGIRVRDGKISLTPHPDRRLGFAEGCCESPLGRIAAGWEYREDGIHYSIEIPAGQEGCLVLPGREPEMLGPGKHERIVTI